ncbi:hypothetical protein [Obesumbacterium proteus]|uniref:hypothetical protein n=1 Tax=Obesumbacterium proteus TaxID=82983 RepID=UPI002432B59A|nr:hypothetical protein [Obesumbacterium proteus]
MQNFINNINNKRYKTLAFLTGAVSTLHTEYLGLEIDEQVTPYAKSSIKDYAILEKHYLSSHYDYFLHISLEDYGILQDDGYFSRQYSDGHLNLYIDSVGYHSCEVCLKGNLYGDTLYDSTHTNKAVYKICAIKKGGLVKLKTEEQLVLEGERLYDEGNLKMAFFMYFSAMESLINSKVSNYAVKIHAELHDALEYLSLDEKLRLVTKEALNTTDFDTIKVWSKIMETFNSSKSKRNLIAHGKSVVINVGDVDNIYVSLLLVAGVLNFGFSTFNGINRKIFK